MYRGKGHFTRVSPLALVVLSLLIPQFLLSSAHVKSPITVTSTSSLKFTVTQEGGAVRSHALLVRNTGKANLEWSASSNQAWLRFEPASGSLAPTAAVSIDFIADPAGFSPGIYETRAKITTANNAPHIFTVTMVEGSAFAGVPIVNAERPVPPDSGMVNVRTQYGAKGDGISDDTDSIQRAISSVVHHPQTGPRIIFFPPGTYLVSRPLLEKDLNGQWNSLLTLQGENRATTILKLTDNNPLYKSAGAPAAVLKLASQHGGPKGGGNSAFDNNVFDITIDVGQGNPGAIALDFLGNNYCALRNVVLKSTDPSHAGAVGLSLQRYASGPCFMKNVLINGFDYGIKVANNEYSLTFEDVTLLNQKRYGIYNANNVLNIRHLFSTNTVPAIHNQNAAGLITVVDAILQRGSPQSSAIENQGTLYARNIRSSGYASVLQNKADKVLGSSISEYDSGPTLGRSEGKELSLYLRVEETAYFEDTNLSNWKSVVTYGADSTGRKDSSAAIQSAIDSGATTVYFPTGVYVAAQTIHLRGNLRVLEGFGSSLNPSGNIFRNPTHPVPLLQIGAGTADVALNHMRIAAYYPHPSPGMIGIQQDSARPFILRDSLIGTLPTTIAYQNTSRGSGTLFVENVSATPWQILFPQNVFARQINPESNATKIINKGGRLWILGLKTEGSGTNIETYQGGATELLGGLIYPVWKIPADRPGFVVNDSRVSFIYAVSNYKSTLEGRNFAIQIEETQHGETKSLLSTSLPSRGLGTMIPLYRSYYPPSTPSSVKQVTGF
jgi:hypothetical protein